MALFFECMLKCARKLLDTADIVREAIYQQSQLFSGVVNFFLCHSRLWDRRRMDIDLQEQPFRSGRDPDWVCEGWRFTLGESPRPLLVSPSCLEIGAQECRDWRSRQ